MALRVLCVDDNPMVGAAIQMKLTRAGCEWLGLLPDASDLLAHVSGLRPDVLLLDVDLPGESPFIAMQRVLEHHPGLLVVMVSGHVRRELIDRAFQAGAWGYVSKTDGAGAILAAIQRVTGGEMAMSPDVEAVLNA